jgi:hypothetical protein
MADEENSKPASPAEAPPTWEEVRSDPGFKDLSPEKKVVTFDRWHNDAFNFVSTLPDFKEHENEFNTKAAQTQTELMKAAGVESPDHARIKIANDAVQTAVTSATQDRDAHDLLFSPESFADLTSPARGNVTLDKATVRDAIAPLGPDVAAAYFNDKAKEVDHPGFWKLFLADRVESANEAVKALALHLATTKTSDQRLQELNNQITAYQEQVPVEAEQTKAGQPPLIAAQDRLPALIAERDSILEGTHPYHTPERDVQAASEQASKKELVDFFDKNIEFTNAGLGVTPEEKKSISGQLAGALGSVSDLAFGNKGMLLKMAADTYAKAHDASIQRQKAAGETDEAKIQDTARLDAVQETGMMVPQLLAFHSGGAIAKLSEKLLPEAASTLTRGLAGAGTSALTNMGVSGVNRLAQGQSFYGDLGQVATDTLFGLAGGVSAAQSHFDRLQAVRDAAQIKVDAAKTPAEKAAAAATAAPAAAKIEAAAPTVADLEKNGAPATAKATADAAIADAATDLGATPTAAAPAAEAPKIRLTSRLNADGTYRHQFDLPADAMVAQLQAFAQNLNTDHLPPEAATAIRSQIADEIAKRTAPAAPPAAPTPEAAPEATPEAPAAPAASQAPAQPFIVSTAIRDSAKPENMVRGDEWNSGHDTFTLKAIESGIEGDRIERGFIVRNPDGTETFVSRKEAAPIAAAAGQAPADVTNLRSQDLIDEPVAASRRADQEPETRAVVAPEGDKLAPAPAARPLSEPAKAPSIAAAAKEYAPVRSPEEKAAKIEEGRTRAHEIVAETGIVPPQNELHKLTGSSTAASQLLKDLRAKVAEDFPPETVPDGSKITETKNSLTGDKLPSVVDADGKVRPQFTNDPQLTAQQIDLGQVSGDEGNRLYVPDEIATTGKVNPAIHLAKEKGTGRRYVLSADAVLPDGTIHNVDAPHATKAGQLSFSDAYQQARRLSGQAQKPLGLTPEILQAVQAKVEQGAKSLGVEPSEPHTEEALDHDPGAAAPAGERDYALGGDLRLEMPSGERAPDRSTEIMAKDVLDNLAALKRIGIDKQTSKPVADVVKFLANDRSIYEGLRTLARTILKSGADLSQIELSTKTAMNSDAAGLYVSSRAHPERGKIYLNTAVPHMGGIHGTFLHEVAHHVTLHKLADNYDRTPIEEKAYQQLRKAMEKATQEAFKDANNGRAGTPEELAKFAKAQGGDKRVKSQKLQRLYYGLSDLREFVAEVLTSPGFQKYLSGIEGIASAPRGKIGNLLNSIRNAVKNLFSGQEVKRGSLMDNALESAFQLVRTPTEQGRMGTGRGTTAEARRMLESKRTSRADLERMADEFGYPKSLIETFSDKELRDSLDNFVNSPEPASTEPKVSGPGFIHPDGTFHPTSTYDSGVGFHDYASMVAIIKNDPKLAKKWKPTNSIGAVQEFLQKNGYARVNDDGSQMYVTSNNGKLSARQRELLSDASIENGMPVIHDFDNGRSRILFDPEAVASRADDRRAPELLHDYVEGKVVHSVSIPADATLEQMQALSKQINDSKIPDADKARLTTEVDERISALPQPHVVIETDAEGKTSTKAVIPKGSTVDDLRQAIRNLANSKLPAEDVTRLTAEFQSHLDKLRSYVTSITNERVDAERTARGQAPLMELGSQTYKEAWDKASEIAANEPEAITNLVAELASKPRAVQGVEDAMLLRRQIDLSNMFQKFSDDFENATATGDDAGAAEAKLRLKATSDLLLQLGDVTKAVGAETGRGLAMRQMLAKEDYSLGNMERRMRVALEGKDLTEKQSATVKKSATRIKKAQDDFDTYMEKRLAAYKKRLEKLASEYEGKNAAGDTTGKPKRPELILDQEALALKARFEQAKAEFQRAVTKAERANRSSGDKARDLFQKWRRASVLSGATTFAKLASAAAERMAFTPLEEATGAVYSRLFPKLAARAGAREGSGFTVSAEAKALAEGFTSGMRDAWQILKTGKSDLDWVYGREERMPRDMADFLGSTHDMIKAPAKRNEFARSLELQFQRAMDTGVDVTDPLVQTRFLVEAYKDANRAIFKQDNRLVSGYKSIIGRLTQPDKNGRVPTWSKNLAFAAQTVLPIVKIPTNIVGETFQYAMGTATGMTKLANAYRKGIETLHPEDATLIMRELKKGSLGAAVLLLGYFGAAGGLVQAGGYYEQGEKRKATDVKAGGVRLNFGGGNHYDIPRYLVHNPLLEMLQLGATVRRVADSKFKKTDREAQGLPSGVLAAGLGLTEEVPFFNEITQIAKAYDPKTRNSFLGELAKSLIVPQGVQQIATAQDKNERTGETQKRKADTILEHIETGIPGVRKTLKKNYR